MARDPVESPLIEFVPRRTGMQSIKTACLVFIFGTLLNAADQSAKFYPPALSCFDTAKQQPPPVEVLRTPVLVSPNQRFRAYARIDATFDQALSPPCRTNAQLLVSSRKSPFKLAFVEKTSEADDAAVSLGPMAWSPDSRWLAVERAAGYYASDFGGIDFLLYDSVANKVIIPNVAGMVAKKIGKHCVLGYAAFNGFDARNRLILQLADWQDDNGRETYCIQGTAEWLYNPVTGEVQPSAAGR
jgi:hypothetical protein